MEWNDSLGIDSEDVVEVEINVDEEVLIAPDEGSYMLKLTK